MAKLKLSKRPRRSPATVRSPLIRNILSISIARLATFMVVFAAIGAILLLGAHAASTTGYPASPQSGTLASPASLVPDPTAIGQQAVQFGTATSGGGGTGGTSPTVPYASALSAYTTLAQSYTGQQMVNGGWAADAEQSNEGGNSCATSQVTYDSANSAAKLLTNGGIVGSSGSTCGHIRSEYTVPTKNSVLESEILMPGNGPTGLLDWGSYWTDGAKKADVTDNDGKSNENWPITGEVDAVETSFGQSFVSVHCGCMADFNASTDSPTDNWTTEPSGWEDKDTVYGTPTGSNIGSTWTVVDIAFNADNSVTIYYNGAPYVTIPASAVTPWNTGYAYVDWGISGPYAGASGGWPTGSGAEEVKYLKVFTK